MTEPVWWSLVLPTLIVVALWKYRVQRWIGRNWNPNISQDAFISSKPIAYWWLGMYFFLVCGFLVALGASQYYGFKVHSAAILGFFSFWWIKYELLGAARVSQFRELWGWLGKLSTSAYVFLENNK